MRFFIFYFNVRVRINYCNLWTWREIWKFIKWNSSQICVYNIALQCTFAANYCKLFYSKLMFTEKSNSITGYYSLVVVIYRCLKSQRNPYIFGHHICISWKFIIEYCYLVLLCVTFFIQHISMMCILMLYSEIW